MRQRDIDVERISAARRRASATTHATRVCDPRRQNLWAQRGSLWHKLKEHFQTEELRKQTLLDQRKILQAIASHDVAGARQAMRAHLERVTRTFSRG